MPVVTDILEDHTGSIFRELLDCMTEGRNTVPLLHVGNCLPVNVA